MPDDHPAGRRTRGAAERDKVALDNIAAILNQPLSCTRAELACHGGLSYANSCMEDGPICHVPEPGEPDDVYWLGFDCGHGRDYSPAIMRGHPPLADQEYRDMAYVRAEVEHLAEQLAAVTA